MGNENVIYSRQVPLAVICEGCCVAVTGSATVFNLGVGTNRTPALCARVGAQLVEALGAHVLVVLLHVFLPVQVVAAVVAVEAVGHGGGEVAPGTWDKEKRRLVNRRPEPHGGSVALC